jgi:hypothetical protein
VAVLVDDDVVVNRTESGWPQIYVLRLENSPSKLPAPAAPHRDAAIG